MATRLKNYFPMIREQAEVLAEIQNCKELQDKFSKWTKEQQDDFLNLCTGARGLKLLYDGFFKEVMNPEYVPERINDFLSHILRQRVKVVKVLPADSVRIADESSLLIMDIVVELEDGSIANLEMQKIGYTFPGQRSACYSADLLLRQYKRIRGKATADKKFNYQDIKNVYTIVLFEKSPQIFHEYPDTHYHFFEQESNTGMKMELLQKYLFIPLDIFAKNLHNERKISKSDAWLTLFSSDDPETIIKLIETYPEFKAVYQECYQICLNMEKVMDMFSEELYQLDRNTVQYMIDEMQNELDAKRTELTNACDQLKTAHAKLHSTHAMLDSAQAELDSAHAKLNAKETTIHQQQDLIDEMNTKYHQSIKNTVEILRNVGLPDSEIIDKLCGQYQFSEKMAKEFL